jgi:ubiquinone/menaquinone biosynthesis C-methylase UbiE
VPDVYATIADANPAMVERLAQALEVRGADPQQQAMLETYLADIAFPPNAHVLDIGCGSGVQIRTVARLPQVAQVTGIDASPTFLEMARRLCAHLPNITLQQADGRALPLEDETVDVVLMHTVPCHVPNPEQLLSEAYRVLKPGGWLAAFDGDYATATVAMGESDPLQCCVAMTIANIVNDPWLVRRLPLLVQEAGFQASHFRSHGYAQVTNPAYLFTLIDRGADMLAASGQVGEELAAALKGEARRRERAGQFFGFIAYASVLSRKP